MSSGFDSVLRQADDLIETVEPRITTEGMSGTYYDAPEQECSAMRARMASAIDRLAPPGSVYREQAAEVAQRKEWNGRKVVWLLGILRAIRDDHAAGYTRSVSELLHAGLFADFLGMAEELHSKDYKDAAAVVTGSVLEEHLRKLAEKHGIAVEREPGKVKKADTLNAEIARSGVYNKLVQKSVTAWLDLRNQAAHGRYGEYDGRQVEGLIRDVRDFLVRHPA
jgi:hypothetical protein